METLQIVISFLVKYPVMACLTRIFLSLLKKSICAHIF